MNKEIKNFIKANLNLIEENIEESWEKVYDNAYESLSNPIIGQFTEILLEAGIDPAKTMDYIPALYLFESNIKEYKIPNNVINIGERAFAFCHNLTSIEMGDNLNKINDSAFYQCTSLTNIIIPKGITKLSKNGILTGCSSLTNIIVDENNQNYKSIDGNLYSKDGKTLIQYAIGKTATEFTIPKGVTNIGNSAFDKCTSLTRVVIGGSVTDIDSFAFYNCKNLKIISYNGIKEKWDNINKGYMWSVGTQISKIICNDGEITL